MKYEIKHRWTGAVLFSLECGSLKLCVEAAVAQRANLSNADLSYADLRDANLSDADLSYADLRDANLSNANLSNANLRDANLSDADLSYADLRAANLSNANLSNANLSNANLRAADLRNANLRAANLSNANLRAANLSNANLRDANLSNANLSNANLSNANLSAANLSDVQKARLSILPDAGDIIGWKSCRDGVIVKLLIPHDSKRSNATGRKCRCEFADVMEVIGGDVGKSKNTSGRGQTITYRAGERVRCVQPFDENRWEECASGIHFYITRVEAEND